MNKSRKEEKSNLLWGFFSSVKLAMVLLIILAIASILGTVVPQRGQGAVEFARGLSPGMHSFLSALNIFDMYHSFWFRLLIGFLALNLIICSIDRFSGAWKRFTAQPRPDRGKPFHDLAPDQSLFVQGEVEDTARVVDRFLKERYKRIQTKEGSNEFFFNGERGRYSHFGVYMVHLSILLIIIGSLVGSFFGFEAFVNIVEGEKIDTVVQTKKGVPLKLGFEVRCDKFNVDFYESGAPKEYRSDLTFFVNGEETEKKSVLVNHPVQFRGITFYQASYGSRPGGRIRLRMARHSGEYESGTVTLEQGDSMQLPGNEGKLRVIDIKGDFMKMGPVARISIQPDRGEEISFWVFKNPEIMRKRLPAPMLESPKFNPSVFKPYTFFLDSLESIYYTGLQVNRDPGVSIVWAGCFLMVAGFFITFFTSHRRIWIRVSSLKQGIRVSVAGTSNKNPVGLQRELKSVINDLRKQISEKG